MRLGLVTMALLGAACAGQTMFDRVAVQVTVSPDSVDVGDPVTLTVSVWNIHNDPVVLSFDTDCQLLYRIVAVNDQQVGPSSPFLCTQGRTTLLLAPGEIADTQFTWMAQVWPSEYRVYGDVGANRAREAGPVPLKVQ